MGMESKMAHGKRGACSMPTRVEVKNRAPRPRSTLGVRMTAEYSAWLEELALRERIGIASLVDRSLAFYAKHVGFAKEPPKRCW
jgi:hypothetical protein